MSTDGIWRYQSAASMNFWMCSKTNYKLAYSLHKDTWANSFSLRSIRWQRGSTERWNQHLIKVLKETRFWRRNAGLSSLGSLHQETNGIKIFIQTWEWGQQKTLRISTRCWHRWLFKLRSRVSTIASVVTKASWANLISSFSLRQKNKLIEAEVTER